LQAAEAAAAEAAAADDDDDAAEEEAAPAPPPPPVVERKRRLSKAERRALKTGQAPRVVPKKASTSFKDATYIQYGDARQEEMDNLLNDAKRDDSAAGAGLQMLEEALLDVAPDEALDMLKRKSMHKWDARKKKYVQQSVSEIIDTRGKRQKNESGQDVKKGATRGELYRKWRERKGGDERVDYRGAKGSRKKSAKKAAPARPVKDEVRNAAQIAKSRREKRDLALKNLPKAKRRALTHKK
jgi:ATP-dependent RNA helicase DDX54/DBP10